MAESRESKIAGLIAKWPQYAAPLAQAIEDGTSFSECQKLVLEGVAAEQGRYLHATPGLHVGDTTRSSHSPAWCEAASDHLVWRACNGRIPGRLSASERTRRESAASEFGSSLSGGEGVLASIARKCMRGNMKESELYYRSLSISTSDLPGVALDAFQKSLHGHFEEAPKTYLPLARIRAASDFKTLNSIGLSGSAALIETPENTPVSEGAAVDVRSQYQLKTYSRSMGLGYQMLVNDDLSAFGALAEMYANGASTLIADLVYNALISQSGTGPNMAEDSIAMFATTHPSGANYIAGVGAPDATGIAALSKLMRLQKGLVAPGEVAPFLGIRPAMILTPVTLAETAKATLGSFSNAEVGGDGAFERNLSLISEPRLDGGTNGTTAWYLVADPRQVPGLEIAALNGRLEPSVEMVQGNNPLGLRMNVILDVGVKFVEHRGWARTKGA